MPKLENQKPKLTNRGGAGLLGKVKGKVTPASEPVDTGKPVSGEKLWETAAKNAINPALKELVVNISSLQPDPDNARLHPDRNLSAIKDSLCLYGQVKPVVVRKKNRTVMAGNGTMEAAKALGWTKIAATIVELSEAQAVGYGLADNRTAELAKWDFEVVARLDRLLQEEGVNPVGWSQDELDVLRMAEWTPPAVSDEEFDPSAAPKLNIKLTEEQRVVFDRVLAIIRGRPRDADAKEPTEGEAFVLICTEWEVPQEVEQTDNEEAPF